MPLPEKDYFSLQEVSARWNLPISDLHYYSTHGLIEVMAWFDVHTANIFQMTQTDDGESFPVVSDLTSYKDYAVIDRDELRQIVRKDGHCVKSFISPNKRVLIKIHDYCEGYTIKANDLVISRNERDRFEVLYALIASVTINDNALPSFSGRPSSMHLVRQHFLERRDQGKLLPSLRQEAIYLDEWAANNIKDVQPPKAKTIMNTIRNDYREYRF